MKSPASKILLVVGLLFLSTLPSKEARAKPGVCDYDCNAHSKTRYPCGVKITWKSQSTKWCEDINIPVRLACEAARSTACKLGGALEESGPDGPNMHYERFQMLPYEQIFKTDLKWPLRVLNVMVDWYNLQKSSPAGMKIFKQIISYVEDHSDTATQQIQAIDDWAKWAGIVCTETDYTNMNNNMPYYYMKQIPVEDFCKKRWQHLSNNWANGFERNRSRESCELMWGLQKFERAPLTFTCGNRMPYLEAMKRDVNAQTNANFKDYERETNAAVAEFLRSVNWNEAKEVKEAQKDLSDARADLFQNQQKTQMFEGQLAVINEQIAVEEAYKRELEAKLGRIMGFIESYAAFIESESTKIDSLEAIFSQKANEMKVYLDERSQKLAQLQSWVTQAKKVAEVGDAQALSSVSHLQASYESLQKGPYQELCVAGSIESRIRSLQGVQAYRMDLGDRLVNTLEYFEDSAEFNEAKEKFTVEAQKLASRVSEKNYVFNDNFDGLKKKPEVCADFEKLRPALDMLAQLIREKGSTDQVAEIRSSFLVRLDSLKAQQKILEQKTMVRNTVYTIMKALEDNFNSGYLTQLYKELVTARKRIVAAGDFAKSVLKEDELKSIQAEVDQKLAYFDQRSPSYIDLQQGRLKLQNRLNRFINEVADFKDQADDQQLKTIAADVEAFLPVIFNYNADRVTAVIPAVANISELSGFDSFLTDVEERFYAIKEALK